MKKAIQKALTRKLQPTYDITKSYEWNYRNGPLFRGAFPSVRRPRRMTRLLDFELNSPIGIAAGPLLNSNWIRVYAKLGFDILSYKTVRTRRRPSNPKPNCVYVDTRGGLTDDRLKETLAVRSAPPTDIREISITNSFGVPSRNPSVWQEDVQRSKHFLAKGQVLVVSTLGSAEYFPDAPSFIKDFARATALAKEAGADIVELDLSCPNSNAAEGMIYQDPEFSGAISRAAKAELGTVPLFIKLGNFWKRDQFDSVIKANAPHVEGIVGINTVKMTVFDGKGSPAIPGRPESGVCGAGIKPGALQFVRWLLEERKNNRYDFVVIGVGGIMTTDDIDEFLGTGADAVETATAAMWDPYLAYRYYLAENEEK